MDNDSDNKRADSVRDNNGIADDGTMRTADGSLQVLASLARELYRDNYSTMRWNLYRDRLKLGLVLVPEEGKETSPLHAQALQIAGEYRMRYAEQQNKEK